VANGLSRGTATMSDRLVLSVFPGIGLLDRAFEEEGFCIVRGPDLLWGGDIRSFYPPAGVFDGVIGGPPCQLYGGLANFAHRWKRQPEHLIPEYERVVLEAAPTWYLMENVPGAPAPMIDGYCGARELLNTRWLGEEQDRLRAITFGWIAGSQLGPLHIETTALEPVGYSRTVTASHGGGRGRMKGRIEHLSVAEALRRQGCHADFFGPVSPFRVDAQRKMIAQGVPLPMGRAIAKAIKVALADEVLSA
jgi:DNA (cytosine-5)-methyltransferase 1